MPVSETANSTKLLPLLTLRAASSEGRLDMKSKLGAALAAGVNALLTILLAAAFLFVVLHTLQQLLRSQPV
jgi:hypothetical protein